MTMKLFGIICAVAVAMPASGAFAVEKPTPKVVSCTQIKTAAQLQAIKNNLKGTYCLANDIDAGSIANFIPIGDAANRFTGQFYGNGHVIRNLKINNATAQYVGMFGVVADGIIQDVGLINAKVSGSFNECLRRRPDRDCAGDRGSGIHHAGVRDRTSDMHRRDLRRRRFDRRCRRQCHRDRRVEFGQRDRKRRGGRRLRLSRHRAFDD